MKYRNRFTLNVCSSKLCIPSTAVIRCFRCSWLCTKYRIYCNPHVCIYLCVLLQLLDCDVFGHCKFFSFVLFASVIILFLILLLFGGVGGAGL